MKTVVKALTPRRVVDGWGFEIEFRRPQDITPGRHYILQNRTIVKELKTQEELMADAVYGEETWVNMDYYEYYLCDEKNIDTNFDIDYTGSVDRYCSFSRFPPK